MAITPQTNTTLAQIADRLRALDDFVICGHVSPDGDCLGSQLALFHALSQLGKRVTCVLALDDPIDESLAFMPGIASMIPARDFAGECRVFIGVDVPLVARIGDAAALLDQAAETFTIDHHACETTMCEQVYVDPDAASASMLVWELVKELVAAPPIESAICAFTGLMTDTGGFRFQNSDERAFLAAADMVAQGIDPSAIATQVFQNRSRASLALEGIVIERMRIFAGGQGVLSWISAQDMERVGAVKSDIDPLIDAIRAVRGTRVACMLREQDGRVRGSLRSKDDTDVAALARTLNGGGHKAAAGLTLDMELPQAVDYMEKRISELLSFQVSA